jgi:hypothetical protein
VREHGHPRGHDGVPLVAPDDTPYRHGRSR